MDTYFGIGSGMATFANAMRKSIPIDESYDPYKDLLASTSIQAIHSARLTASQFMMFGTYCLALTGEP